MTLLNDLVGRMRLEQVGHDEYRQTSGTCPVCNKSQGDNPHLAVSSKGWFDHRINEGGSLAKLAGMLGMDVPEDAAAPPPNAASAEGPGEDNGEGARIYGESTLTSEDRVLVQKYFAGRGIRLGVEKMDAIFDFRNNVVYNWEGSINLGIGQFNIINNYYRPGPNTKTGDKVDMDLIKVTAQCRIPRRPCSKITKT